MEIAVTIPCTRRALDPFKKWLTVFFFTLLMGWKNPVRIPVRNIRTPEKKMYVTSEGRDMSFFFPEASSRESFEGIFFW